MAASGSKIVFLFIFNFINSIYGQNEFDNNNTIVQNTDLEVLTTKNFVIWPDATIPFYINQDHFDNEQAVTIMGTLSFFAFKTCLKFAPVMVPPAEDHHVLVFENPEGSRLCELMKHGHPKQGPHRILLGYECLKSPMLELIVMRALGFPLEHNRVVRDNYIDVQLENIVPNAIELFTKEFKLPAELRAVPYDINSVLHFGERDYSKNGHRTIIFKDHNTKQNRNGLSEADLRKIEIVYGPECQHRDRQEKIELCHQYPGNNRRKREAEVTQNLRVNRDITPPPEVTQNKNISKEVSGTLKDLGIAEEVQSVVDDVYKISAKALANARLKYCNETKASLRNGEDGQKPDILGIIEIVADYAQSMVDHATGNLSMFCEKSDSMDVYQRHCVWNDNHQACKNYKVSTKSGDVMYSTQHRPAVIRSTWNVGGMAKVPKYRPWRSGDQPEADNVNETQTESEVTKSVRRKRQASLSVTVTPGSARKMGTRMHEDRKGKYESVRRQDSEGGAVADGAGRVRRSIEDSDSERQDSRESEERRIRNSQNLPTTVMMSKLNEEFYAQRRWPHGVVRYIISKKSKFDIEDLRNRLQEVNLILKRRTCVQIKEIWERDAKKYEDYLVIDNSPDYVTGRVGGRQIFGCSELLKGGQHRQHTAMMVMAMLGFYFEVSRHDRDKYVRVHLRHVRADKLHHFEKIRSEATLPLDYDYKSATHPAWQFWRKIGITGISTVATYKDQDPDGSIMRSLGQNEQLLSENDIIKINTVYGIQCMIKPDEDGRRMRKHYHSDND
ncbi:uncharacterized protein [Choristoneura fumiferana]|uniref:uncharacterized protein n=1 Tax=Choristoneura fumiferana TaxID=7141 RepID=UPI003D15970D